MRAPRGAMDGSPGIVKPKEPQNPSFQRQLLKRIENNIMGFILCLVVLRLLPLTDMKLYLEGKIVFRSKVLF